VNPIIVLSFRYSENEYVRALRAHYASHLRLPLDIIAVVVMAVAGACFWRSPSLHWVGFACAAISIVFVLILIAVFTVIPMLAFRSEPKFRDEYSLTFSEQGIHFRTAHVDSQLQWSMYSRALVDSHSYLLYYGSRQFTVIPKRVFEGEEQQLVFEQMLTQHVPEIVRRST
jgi:hypothetical protein